MKSFWLHVVSQIELVLRKVLFLIVLLLRSFAACQNQPKIPTDYQNHPHPLTTIQYYSQILNANFWVAFLEHVHIVSVSTVFLSVFFFSMTVLFILTSNELESAGNWKLQLTLKFCLTAGHIFCFSFLYYKYFAICFSKSDSFKLHLKEMFSQVYNNILKTFFHSIFRKYIFIYWNTWK